MKLVAEKLAEKLAMKWQRSYSEVMEWVQARMSFAIVYVRATNRCIRGSRVKWRSRLGMDEGAGLAIIMHRLTNNSLY